MYNIYIICDNYKKQHRNIIFYYTSLVFKYAFDKIGYTTKILFNIDKCIINNIVLIYPHLFYLLNNINCKIILYNSESLYIQRNKHILKDSKDKRVIMVWDYTFKNIKYKLKNHIFIPPVYIPIQFYNSHNYKKNIDILFYGATHLNSRRYNIKQEILKLNKNIMWVGTFNSLQHKINCINKAKIILIVHTYKEDLPIDYFRINELILNKSFFIIEKPQIEDIKLYNRYKNYFIFSDYNNIIDKCLLYLNKTQKERDIVANNLYNFYKNEEPIEKYINYDLMKKYNLHKDIISKNINYNLDEISFFIINKKLLSINKYYNTIRQFYPNNKIFIINDESLDNIDLTNCIIIKNKYKNKSDIIGYYYFYKLKPSKNAIIISNIISLNKFIDFGNFINCRFLWNDNQNKYIKYNKFVLKILRKLKNKNIRIINKLINFYRKKKMWNICYLSMSVINYQYLDFINNQTKFFDILLNNINENNNNEFSIIFSVIIQYFNENNENSLLGSIDL